MTARIPLTLLGGFLGAGKSTWARHQLHIGQFARHHILVNEAAETPVDNLLLGAAHRVSVLAGGCACCTGQAALIAALREICDHATGKGAGEIDGILLETSGLADPAAIAAAIAADPILTRRLIWRETIVLIDAEHGVKLLQGEALARRQIEAADRLIITRVAQAKPQHLASMAATLAIIAPDAEIGASEMGMPLALPTLTAAPLALPEITEAAPITPFRLAVGSEGGWVALSTWLSALLQARGDELVRVKGVVRTPAGRLLIQSVRRIVQPPEILPADNAGLAGPAPDEDMLVLIGRNIDANKLRRSWAIYGA